MNNTRYRIAFVSRLAISALKQSAVLTGVSLCIVCGVLADDIAVSEQSFSCINDWPKIRNTHIYNADPEKLKEAIRIFRDSVSDTEYPVGTILQLIPTEAMVKHSRGTFAKSNDWEFFSLDVSAAGTKISERGENVVNHTQGLTCLSCHQPAAKYDFVCEKTHGCAPIPLDDQKIAELQGADPRCAKKDILLPVSRLSSSPPAAAKRGTQADTHPDA
jgi:hypothetical protein